MAAQLLSKRADLGGSVERPAQPGRVPHTGIAMSPIETRRRFFLRAAGGIGSMALAQLLAAEDGNPLTPKPPHFPGSAKSVIFLFMPGGPSQIDLFDPKPELKKWHGRSLPLSLTKDLKLAFIKPTAQAVASPRDFRPCGESGIELSD